MCIRDSLTYREQGFIVARGNPKGIRDVRDLCRKGVRFINRQRGAGTRLLLDYMLKLQGIDPSEIDGYNRHCFTHTAVAIAVSSGVADVGLGIHAAAYCLNLDFIPINVERYDILVSREEMSDFRVKKAIEIINSRGFQDRIKRELRGDNTKDTGKILYCNFPMSVSATPDVDRNG